jgi:hypothetical protein
MNRSASVVAARTLLATMWASRAGRVLLAVVGLTAAATSAAAAGRWLGASTLADLRALLIVPGLPAAAVLLAELPLRDGLTSRTLLYPLLGPVPRFTLALVRTLIAVVVLALPLGLLVLLLRLLGGVPAAGLGGELAAVGLGSACYVGYCGLLHLESRHGLVAGLALVLAVDYPLALAPFSLRALAPATHVANLSGRSLVDTQGLPLSVSEISVGWSAGVLAVVAAGAILLTAWRFSRRNLEDLC